MRSILCPIDGAKTLDDRLETALALARATDGHVSVQIASPFAELAVWEPFGGAALTAEVIDQVRQEDTVLAQRVDARLAPQDVPFDVMQTAQAPIPAAYAAARFADVVVTSLADPLVEELVLGVRSPVLAVPQGAPLTDFTGPAMVAWDGGIEAAHALRAALPCSRGPARSISSRWRKSPTPCRRSRLPPISRATASMPKPTPSPRVGRSRQRWSIPPGGSAQS
ncbi:hypothetical protein ACFS32_02265 [Novosphingobium pokkalii]|uniref:hypothetical protein n=1 Tax=Novosphingobium pokkalii TaxID=1770194 RepID=UPI00363627EB